MAKISQSRGRPDENSGYVRVLGSPELGRLLSRVQATVIRNGNELERLLKEHCPYYSADVQLEDMFLGQNRVAEETIALQIAEESNRSPTPVQAFFTYRVEEEGKGIVADVIIVDHPNKIVHVVELKDGDTFDTKKASGELISLTSIARLLGGRLGYQPQAHFCAFNQPDKAAIVAGAKGRFGPDVAMTGPELCELLGVDYAAIRQIRKADEADNLEFFLTELLAIPDIRARIKAILQETRDGS